MRCWLIVFVVLGLIVPAWASAEEDHEDDAEELKELKKKVEALEKRLEELEGEDSWSRDHIASMPWEPDRDFTRTPGGWFVTTHGYLRTRALLDANSANGYTNKSGETLYAYDPHSTFKNDYGWWDSRFSSRTVINFGNTAEIVAHVQFGDWAWGSQAPSLGGTGRDKFDHATLWVRELWTRYEADPIPLVMEFGRMPWTFGNALIQGNEQDGARGYFLHDAFEFGFGAFRQYEGENYEFRKKYNDDEDTFVAWLDLKPGERHRLATFLWWNLFETPKPPAPMNPRSPLFLLPGYTHERYASQGSELVNAGVNYVADLGAGFGLNLEYDQQWGEIKAGDLVPGVDPIHFLGVAALARLDWRTRHGETIALVGGYGRGDDPATLDYEGYFAPDNRFGVYDELMSDNIRSGYFHVYEFVSPGAGVPGRLRDNLGTGGIENTTFVNLAWDSYALLRNHHFYTSVGYIQASEPNPETNDAVIGVETDMRVDYLFSNNVAFALYGGHLFMLGEYFRENAHDAAVLRGEWRVTW